MPYRDPSPPAPARPMRLRDLLRLIECGAREVVVTHAELRELMTEGEFMRAIEYDPSRPGWSVCGVPLRAAVDEITLA